MRIADFLDPRAVEADLRASNKPGVLRELVGLTLRANPDLDPNQLVDALLRREKLQSTGIGDGIAIPHGKTDGVPDIVGCLGRSVEGVDYQSLDGQPSHLFFTLLVPANQHGVHLKALARISRLFKDPGVREALLAAEDSEAMYRALIEEDDRL